MRYRWDGDALLLQLRVQPKAKSDEFAGLYGDERYKVRISAPPMVGVPAFTRCVCGPSSRTGWPPSARPTTTRSVSPAAVRASVAVARMGSPTADQVQQFVSDPDPKAFDQLVDRLLESAHYGERWGRHWLDLVRYAETNSFERDGAKPNAWKYRDYVIKSFSGDDASSTFDPSRAGARPPCSRRSG